MQHSTEPMSEWCENCACELSCIHRSDYKATADNYNANNMTTLLDKRYCNID